MTRFNPSPYSHLPPQPLARYNKGGYSSMEFNDGGGTDWRVFSDGSVEAIKSSYKGLVEKGRYPAGGSQTNQILSNIRGALDAAGQARFDSLLGKDKVSALPSARYSFSSSSGSSGGPSALAAPLPGTEAAPGEAGGKGGKGEKPKPITQELWFWPAVILGTTSVLSLGIVIVYKASQKKKTKAK
jgi:hypothetical protein